MNFLAPLYLGIVSRICGSRIKYLGLFLYPVPYVLLMDGIYAALAVFAWVFVWKLTGHADGFMDYERDNFLSPVVKLFGFDREGKAYDAAFWATKGSLITLLPSILIGNYWILIASAIGYPLAYWIGFNKVNIKYSTTVGEFLGGVIAGLGFLTLQL